MAERAAHHHPDDAVDKLVALGLHPFPGEEVVDRPGLDQRLLHRVEGSGSQGHGQGCQPGSRTISMPSRSSRRLIGSTFENPLSAAPGMRSHYQARPGLRQDAGGGTMVLNPAHLIATALGEELVANYREMFGDRHPPYVSILRGTAKLVIERIANSDALYHDSHHTADGDPGRPGDPEGAPAGRAAAAGRLAALHDRAAVPRPRLPARHLPGRYREQLRHQRAGRHGAGAARRLGRLPHAPPHRARQDLRAASLRGDRGARCRAHRARDRAHPLPGAGGQRPRRDRHRGRPACAPPT